MVARCGTGSRHRLDRMDGLHESVLSMLVGLLMAPATLFWGGRTRLPTGTFCQQIESG